MGKNKHKHQKPNNRAIAPERVETRTEPGNPTITPNPVMPPQPVEESIPAVEVERGESPTDSGDHTSAPATVTEEIEGVEMIRFRVIRPFAEIVDGEHRHFKPGEIYALPAERVAALGELVEGA